MLLLGAALLALTGCAGLRASARGEAASSAAEPLSETERVALDKVQRRVHGLLVIELLRPAGSSLDEPGERDLSEKLRVALMLVELVWSSPQTEHYEVARTLGTIYATGTSLGWPGASQLAELFLQRAVELGANQPDGWEVLGMLHLMTGDVRGAVHFLETARELSTGASPSVLMALAQAYHLSGRQPEAEAALAQVLSEGPDAELPRLLLELVQVAAEAEASVFRTPRTLQSEPFRPRAVQTALALPWVDYRNLAHGFAVSVPWDWTLQDESTDRELSSECRPMAYAAWDLPLDAQREASASLSRVRVAAFPVPRGADAESLAAAGLPFVKLPRDNESVRPVLAGSAHRYWREGEREGEVVFVVEGQMGFVLQYVATPQDYAQGREGFEALVRSFRALAPGAYAPPGCLGEAPI